MTLVFIMYGLFASIFTVSKFGLQFVQPLFLVGARMPIAGILLLLYQYIFNRKEFVFRKDLMLKITLLGVFAIYLTNALEFWGLQYLSSAKTCFIYSLSPFVSAVLSYWILKEVLTTKKWIGLAVGFIGFIPVLFFGEQGEGGDSLLFLSWPEISVMLAACASVYGWILMRSLVCEGQYPFIMANGISMLIGGALSLIHSLLVENWNPVPVSSYTPFLQTMAMQIVISNIICYNLYGYLLKHFTAPFLSFAGFSTPFFTVILGRIFLGETVTWGFWASACIVILGLILFYTEELRTTGVRKEIS